MNQSRGRDHLARELQANERLFRNTNSLTEGRVDDDRRIHGRECVRDERCDFFAPHAGSLVSSGSPLRHLGSGNVARADIR